VNLQAITLSKLRRLTHLTHKRFAPDGVKSSIIENTQLLKKAAHFDS
jgi:hypothetical protein